MLLVVCLVFLSEPDLPGILIIFFITAVALAATIGNLNDFNGLKNAINNGYVGISLLKSDNKSNSYNKICFAKLL
jgi:hypothetical protein